MPRYRVKLLVFALCAVAALVALDVCYSTLHILSRLDVVEAERDRWQRPSDIITALNLSPGGTVVDLGSGSGYFALKLSSPVGPEGRVIAEDIRRMPLAFLWMRTVRKGKRNVHVSLGESDDPRLPAKSVNAVLISNTYHEFDNPQNILVRVSVRTRVGRPPRDRRSCTESSRNRIPGFAEPRDFVRTGRRGPPASQLSDHQPSSSISSQAIRATRPGGCL